MSRAFLALLCGLGLIGGSLAQTATDADDGFRVGPDGPDAISVSWYSHLGRTYFLQHSEDLITWNYIPDILEPGGNAVISYGFSVSGTARFYRLKYPDPDIPNVDPYYGDFDGDKVNNLLETVFSPELGTDPLLKADSDGDGIPDDWERRYGLNRLDPNDAAGNLDGDSLSNLQEYQNGGTGSDPTDWYNAGYNAVVLPLIQAVSGDGQMNQAGTFSQPLIIELKYGGTTAVNGGPVTLSINHPSFAQISATPNGNGLATTLPLTTDANGRVSVYFKCSTPFADGDASLSITARIGSQVQGGAYALNVFSATTQDKYPYPPGTVGYNVTDAIDSRIAATNQIVDFKSVFSTQNHGTLQNPTPTYIRNTSSWCYDLRQQMTCISPWNDASTNLGAGTAITARHIIGAYHNRLPVDTSIRFITANAGAGNAEGVIELTIIGRADHSANDVSVYTLSASLPGTITPCKILPANYGNYLSYLGGGRPPVMSLDKEEKALVEELRSLGNGLAIYAKPAFHTDRVPFYEDLIPGDSGNPTFLIIKPPLVNDAALVLLSTFTSGGAGSGHFVTNLNPTLNAMIAAADADAIARQLLPVSTGLQVQTVDLSGFSEFVAP